MTYSTLETTLSQGVAVIWLNRPEIRNAMSVALISELTDAVSSAADARSAGPTVLWPVL